jgi:uncharacterized protein (TIGR02646 family)
MIRIKKPLQPPARLRNEGRKKAQQHQQAYDNDPSAKFSFAADIYGHPTVKDALIAAQHKKCCFCESLVGNDGDVEHFRPKSGYRQESGDPLVSPGYYWLAYEWSNLYLSCSACNQRQKGNLFPIDKSSKRAHTYQNDIAVEKPLFIDPGQEDPDKYISFRAEVAHSLRRNTRGIATINSLGLNREVLQDARLRHFQPLKILYEVKQIAKNDPNNLDLQKLAIKAEQLIQDAILDSAEFAAATRQAVKTNFKGVLDP